MMINFDISFYNKIRHKAYRASEYAENAEREREKKRHASQLERKRKNAYQIEYHAEHRDADKVYKAKYYIDHKEKLAAKNAKYYAEHKERIKACISKYRLNHLKLYAAIARTRRACKANTSVSDLTNTQWQERVDEHQNLCAYCLRPMTKVTMDHLIPLSRGGSHTLNNVVPCCRSCNSKKGTKTLLEYITTTK